MAIPRPELQANLLRIPQETRDNIYSFIDHANDFRRLWVCRQLYSETREAFYDRFALEIDVFADARYLPKVHSDVDGTSRQRTVRHGPSPVRYGPWGGRPVLRPLDRKIPQGASLRNVHVLVCTGWSPIKREVLSCPFCRDVGCCMHFGGLFFGEIRDCLSSKIDPQVIVKLYYNLDWELDLVSESATESARYKKVRMLGLFHKDDGLPQCKTLIIYCSAGHRTSPEVRAPDHRVDLEWRSIYKRLCHFIRDGSSLEHLEIWLPECIFRLDQTEASESRRRLKHGNEFLAFLRHHQENFGRPWMFYQQTNLSLGSVKLMVWNDQERPSQQSVPVRALEFEELTKYLRSWAPDVRGSSIPQRRGRSIEVACMCFRISLPNWTLRF
ncbi:MAG: hypothetical protein LQ349_006069 [Xanthoria aureola]|nr:MAG: hypothetical protein LQ349_006069 [Xanthoria aureola]